MLPSEFTLPPISPPPGGGGSLGRAHGTCSSEGSCAFKSTLVIFEKPHMMSKLSCQATLKGTGILREGESYAQRSCSRAGLCKGDQRPFSGSCPPPTLLWAIQSAEGGVGWAAVAPAREGVLEEAAPQLRHSKQTRCLHCCPLSQQRYPFLRAPSHRKQ
ncbi:UNVERIFIED_CONTAM: hypothetical protein K2H54_054830 [Gekko kuhli]